MSTAETINQLEYPESDGRPMGETEIHRRWMIRIDDALRQRYQGRDVYVGSDLLVYYQRDNPKQFVIPDHFVVLNSDAKERRIFRVWEEADIDVVIEVTSRSTKLKDESSKPQIYASMGVKEYFLYDPLAEYLNPSLQGFSLRDGEFQSIPATNGIIRCMTLGIELRLDQGRLVMTDVRTGAVLMTEAETERQQKEHERREKEYERRQKEQERHQKEQERRQKEYERQQKELALQRVLELEEQIRKRDKSDG